MENEATNFRVNQTEHEVLIDFIEDNLHNVIHDDDSALLSGLLMRLRLNGGL